MKNGSPWRKGTKKVYRHLDINWLMVGFTKWFYQVNHKIIDSNRVASQLWFERDFILYYDQLTNQNSVVQPSPWVQSFIYRIFVFSRIPCYMTMCISDPAYFVHSQNAPHILCFYWGSEQVTITLSQSHCNGHFVETYCTMQFTLLW